MTDSTWVVVESYNGLIEAELAAGRLTSAGIPSRVDAGGNSGLFGPGHQMPLAGVDLLVPAAALHAAQDALDLSLDEG